MLRLGLPPPSHLFLKSLACARKAWWRWRDNPLLVWFTVGPSSSPSPTQSSTQLINQSHFHEWWKLYCFRGYRELINPSGQQARLRALLSLWSYSLQPRRSVSGSLFLPLISTNQLMRSPSLGTVGAHLNMHWHYTISWLLRMYICM